MAAGTYSLERVAAETAAVFAVRVEAVLLNSVTGESIDTATTVDDASYHRPTFWLDTSALHGGADDLAVVCVDRAAGEIAGIAVGAVGTHTGFSGTIAAALLAAGIAAGDTLICALYDAPTFILIAGHTGAGNALECQVVDNVLATGADIDPGGWTTGAIQWYGVGSSGGAVFVSD